MKLSAVVLTKNNQDEIGQCLGALARVDEIVVVDGYSTDKTIRIARSFGAKVFSKKLISFSSQRNFGIKQASHPWVLFVDSDERVSPPLMTEIKTAIDSTEHSAFRIKRANYFFSRRVRHGGYWPDWQTRLFKAADFKGYTGKIHETPHWQGSLGSLTNCLLHYSHKNMEAVLTKSTAWTKIEAGEFIKAGHPPITWWRLFKVTLWEFGYRYFKKLGCLDGFVGFIEASVQAMNRFFVYVQIWELQKNENRSL